MQQSTRNILGIAIAVLTGLLVFNASVAWRQTQRLYDQSDLVAHTPKVDAALAHLLQTLTNAETGQRGYLLTSQKRYPRLTIWRSATPTAGSARSSN